MAQISVYNNSWNETDKEGVLQLLGQLNELSARIVISNVTHCGGTQNGVFVRWVQIGHTHLRKSNHVNFYNDFVERANGEIIISL